MNHFFTTLLALSIAAPAFAQPIITSDIQPLPGDECSYLYNGTGIPYGLGPDQYWDLSAIAYTSSTDVAYVLPDTTPGFVYYPTSDVAWSSTLGYLYEYYDMTPTAWTVIGVYFIGSGDHIDLIDPFVAMPFPWTYGTDWEDPFSYMEDGEMVYDTIRWEATTYGTVRLPGGHELDVVGMVEHREFPNTITGSVEYEEDVHLYAPGVRCRVASFGMSWTENPGAPPSGFSAYVRALDDATIGMAETTVSDGMEVWPVPTSGTLNVRCDGTLHKATAQVFDATGRLQFTTSLRSGEGGAAIDVNTLVPGHYILHVNDAERTLVRPFIVE